jgi:guanylate cyclase
VISTDLLTKGYLSRIADAVSESSDSEELRLQKSLLVIASLLIMIAAILWGGLYLYFDEPVAGSIPLTYSFLTLASLIIFLVTRQYSFYRTSQLILILMLPFFLMVALGGFVNSSAVILWSVLCPLSALILLNAREAPRWMLVYLSLLILGGYLQPHARVSNNLPAALVVPLFFIMNIGAVTGIAFLLLYYFVRERNRAYQLLREEQDRSESLLLNVLPEEIAPILKADDRTIADYFESASVLFADIVGSTPLFAGMDPNEIVNWLNEIFSMFDRLVEKHGIEKIRTIGDNYMVASGVPKPRPDHAQVIARLALDMFRGLDNVPPRNGNMVNFRIGINSGPMVAGVIGKTKFHYDLWGDTVNTASRMESHGEPGRIQISDETYQLIQDQFVCEPRGAVAIKGKGEMDTWFLISEIGD